MSLPGFFSFRPIYSCGVPGNNKASGLGQLYTNQGARTSRMAPQEDRARHPRAHASMPCLAFLSPIYSMRFRPIFGGANSRSPTRSRHPRTARSVLPSPVGFSQCAVPVLLCC